MIVEGVGAIDDHNARLETNNLGILYKIIDRISYPAK